jgi:hypothetical protein
VRTGVAAVMALETRLASLLHTLTNDITPAAMSVANKAIGEVRTSREAAITLLARGMCVCACVCTDLVVSRTGVRRGTLLQRALEGVLDTVAVQLDRCARVVWCEVARIVMCCCAISHVDISHISMTRRSASSVSSCSTTRR